MTTLNSSSSLLKTVLMASDSLIAWLGREVFRTIDIKESWDGKDADDGTYYYIIKAESIIGKQFDEKGFFLRLEK